MVCWIIRARRLMLKLPNDEGFERELMRFMDVDSHDELEREIERTSDEEMVRIFTELVNRRKSKDKARSQLGREAEASPYL